VLRRDPRDDGRDERLPLSADGRAGGAAEARLDGCGSLCGDSASASARRLGGAGSGRARLCGGGLAARRPPFWAELRPNLDRLALLDEDLRQGAAPGARHLGVDLVGRDLEQGLVGLDVLALLLEPAGDRPLRDGHAHLRHDDVDSGLRGHALL
jgi:hypothetical protein